MNILVSLLPGNLGAVLSIGGEYPHAVGNSDYLVTESVDERVLGYMSGLFLDIDSGQIHSMGTAPSPAHVWSWALKEWLYDSALQNANTSRLLVDSLAAIDTAAGNARLKHPIHLLLVERVLLASDVRCTLKVRFAACQSVSGSTRHVDPRCLGKLIQLALAAGCATAAE